MRREATGDEGERGIDNENATVGRPSTGRWRGARATAAARDEPPHTGPAATIGTERPIERRGDHADRHDNHADPEGASRVTPENAQ